MKKKIAVFFLVVLLIVIFLFCGCARTKENYDAFIGIAWSADSKYYEQIARTLDVMNIKYVVLDQVKTELVPYDGIQVSSAGINEQGYLLEKYADDVKKNIFEKSNVVSVIKNIDGVIFPGGFDISPSLYKKTKPWHGIDEEISYDAATDVSDYILMNYCIQNDIPVFGICRGMQVLGVCCGVTITQDIPTQLKNEGIQYDYTHREFSDRLDSNRDFASHDVLVIDKDSVLYDIAGDTILKNVPSWHHQSIANVDGTNLKVTGVTNTCGHDIIEAIQYIGKKYITGIQFHPEVAVVKNIDKEENASNYMPKEQAEKFFSYFYDEVKTLKD